MTNKKYNFAAIKEKTTIAEVIGRVVKLKKHSNHYKGLCPFQIESTPSFAVYENSYYCYGCKAHGDVVDFVVQYEGCSYEEAIDRLGASEFKLTQKDHQEIGRREKEHKHQRQAAIAMAIQRWEAAPPADPDNAYLARKQVQPHMARLDGKALLIPVYDRNGDMQNVQTISADGSKLFQWGAHLKNDDGSYQLDEHGHKVRGAGAPAKGGRLNFGICIGRSIVCEGFATGASIYEAVPDRVVVGFSKYGCIDLIRELHGNGQEVAIAADRNALAEMLKLGKELGIPVYAPDDPYDDFNDMAVAIIEAGDDPTDAIKAIFRGEPLHVPEPAPTIEVKAANDDHDNSGPVDIWAKPMPPVFPRGIFPKPIEDLAIHRGEQAGCDPSGIAMAALTASAGVISDTITLKMRVHEPWFERPLLWGMLVGLPSTNKSAMLKYSTAQIKKIDGEMFAENSRKLRDWQEDGGTKSGEPMPPMPRLRVEDITMESAQEVCRYSQHGVISIQNELNGFFGGIQKHSGGGGGLDRSFWIGAYDGGQYAVNRIGRGGATGYIIDNLSVGIIGGIQPDVIKAIMNGYSDDGIIQRFLPIILHDGDEGEDKPAPDVGGEFDALIDRLHAMRLEAGGEFFMKQYIEFSPEAQEVQYRTSTYHKKLVKSFEEVNGTLASHFGKYNGFFGRLCITMHCIESVNTKNGPSRYISLETAERVEHLLHKFLLPHSIAFYTGILGLSEGIDRVKAVAGYILAHKLETVTMRTIGRNVSAMKRVDRQEAAKVFEQLEAFGWLEQTNKRHDAPSWNVDARVHEKFAERALSEAERRADVRGIIAETVDQIRSAKR